MKIDMSGAFCSPLCDYIDGMIDNLEGMNNKKFEYAIGEILDALSYELYRRYDDKKAKNLVIKSMKDIFR